MANLMSAKKRVRQNEKHRLYNRYYAKTMRTLLKRIREEKDKEQARQLFPELQRQLDKLVRRNIIHRNKAANIKSSVAKALA